MLTQLFVNRVIVYSHLVDSLIKLNFDIRKIFAPEHGFRGSEPNGANIDDEIDICKQLSGLLNDLGYNSTYSITSGGAGSAASA